MKIASVQIVIGTWRAESGAASSNNMPQNHVPSIAPPHFSQRIRSRFDESRCGELVVLRLNKTGRPYFSGRPVSLKQTGLVVDLERRRRIATIPIRPAPTSATVDGSGTLPHNGEVVDTVGSP